MRVGRVQRAHEIAGRDRRTRGWRDSRATCSSHSSALVQSEKMKGAAVGALLDEGGAAEHEREHAKPVSCVPRSRSVSRSERSGTSSSRERSISKIFFQTRLRALVIEPPKPAVGEDRPLDAAIGERFGTRQVAQDLAGGDFPLLIALPRPLGRAVERAVPTFVLDDRDAMAIALVPLGLGVRPSLCVRIGQQQHVRDIGTALARRPWLDDPDVPVPADHLQNPKDQILFGLRLVGLGLKRELLVDLFQPSPDARTECRIGREPLVRRGRADAVCEKVLREQLPRIHRSGPMGSWGTSSVFALDREPRISRFSRAAPENRDGRTAGECDPATARHVDLARRRIPTIPCGRS